MSYETKHGHLIGYARVSTDAQSLGLQLDALESLGCNKIFQDTISGASSSKEGLKEALAYLRPGDTLVVWRLDRLGRTVKGLIELTGALEEQGIHLHSLKDSIDTSTPSGRFYFHVMAALSQMEREMLRERTQAGLKAARARGRLGGRRRLLSEARVNHAKVLIDGGLSVTEAAQTLGVSRATLYRALKR